jgi:hypothetical protein
MNNLFDRSGAEISTDHIHRYGLWRVWDKSLKRMMFIGVNPSTAEADEATDDQTIHACTRIAKYQGYGGFFMGNLFSFRSRDPEILRKNLSIAIGPACDEWLKMMITASEKVVCAWGSWKFLGDRPEKVLAMVESPYCISVNDDGNPKHPLFTPASTSLIPFFYEPRKAGNRRKMVEVRWEIIEGSPEKIIAVKYLKSGVEFRVGDTVMHFSDHYTEVISEIIKPGSTVTDQMWFHPQRNPEIVKSLSNFEPTN